MPEGAWAPGAPELQGPKGPRAACAWAPGHGRGLEQGGGSESSFTNEYECELFKFGPHQPSPRISEYRQRKGGLRCSARLRSIRDELSILVPSG
jgi:hypothetical protein